MDNNLINQLNTKVAYLESKNDQLEAELAHLDERLVRCGFSEGIKTLKETVEELLEQEAVSPRDNLI